MTDDKQMPEGWKRLKGMRAAHNPKGMKTMDEAVDLMAEMAEALDLTINPNHGEDLEARRLVVAALKKFKEWK